MDFREEGGSICGWEYFLPRLRLETDFGDPGSTRSLCESCRHEDEVLFEEFVFLPTRGERIASILFFRIRRIEGLPRGIRGGAGIPYSSAILLAAEIGTFVLTPLRLVDLLMSGDGTISTDGAFRRRLLDREEEPL